VEGKRIRFISIIAGILVPVCLSSAEVVCGEQMRLKPLRCVCGNFTNAAGEPVPEVMVMVIKDGTEVAHVKTGQDGKFRFGELKSGNYELIGDATGYRTFRSAIVVAKPENKCKQAILLDTGGLESCGSHVIKQ
jgi:hypothetical protein